MATGVRSGQTSAGAGGMIPRTRTLPCACGGTIRADRHKPMAGVRAHQRTRLHQEWRKGASNAPTGTVE
jgi:hypothetical protein